MMGAGKPRAPAPHPTTRQKPLTRRWVEGGTSQPARPGRSGEEPLPAVLSRGPARNVLRRRRHPAKMAAAPGGRGLGAYHRDEAKEGTQEDRLTIEKPLRERATPPATGRGAGGVSRRTSPATVRDAIFGRRRVTREMCPLSGCPPSLRGTQCGGTGPLRPTPPGLWLERPGAESL